MIWNDDDICGVYDDGPDDTYGGGDDDANMNIVNLAPTDAPKPLNTLILV